MSNHIKPTIMPDAFLENVRRPSNQLPEHRQYRYGYAHYLGLMPRLSGFSSNLDLRLDITRLVMGRLASDLAGEGWIESIHPEPGKLERIFIGIEDVPAPTSGPIIETGAELIVVKWGHGFATPVHGHGPGLLHEELVSGKMMVDFYRLVNEKARPVQTIIYDKLGTIVSSFGMTAAHPYANAPHRVTALEPTVTVHYLPEHPHDGKANRLETEEFLLDVCNEDIKRITPTQALNLKVGEVVLVRSAGSPELGDHYLVSTGQYSVMPNGIRPTATIIRNSTEEVRKFLDSVMLNAPGKLVILQLGEKQAQQFRDFHGIEIKYNKLILPKA